MNTRVQVEHSVTEMATGIDIVREQILIAAGEPLSFAQEDVELRGHAIECRINAEDASKNFAPAPGAIGRYREPAGPFVRVDSGVEAGAAVLPYYDPMIAKLIVWDRDREAATRRMLRALDEYEIEGLKTLLPFHRALLRTDQWADGATCRDLIGDRAWLKGLAPVPRRLSDLPRRVTQARRGRPERSPGWLRSLIGVPSWGVPFSSTTIPRWRSCGSSIASLRSLTGPTQASRPSSSASHSSRDLVRKSSRHVARASGSNWVGTRSARPDALAQLAPERRLERADREVAAVGALVERVARDAAGEQIPARSARPRSTRRGSSPAARTRRRSSRCRRGRPRRSSARATSAASRPATPSSEPPARSAICTPGTAGRAPTPSAQPARPM